MAQFRTSRTFDLIFLVLLALLICWSWVNRVAIGDWVYFLRYQPSTETAQIADDAGLSPGGRRLLYRTDPQFASRAVVAAACDLERLGCIDSKGRVYILDEADRHEQTIVTAAHEMLHLAYRRLSDERKAELAPVIDQAIAMNATEGIREELSSETTTDDRRDEAHSILGTEYRSLPSGLEEYYSQYFSDRAKVVAAQAASQR